MLIGEGKYSAGATVSMIQSVDERNLLTNSTYCRKRSAELILPCNVTWPVHLKALIGSSELEPKVCPAELQQP